MAVTPRHDLLFIAASAARWHCAAALQLESMEMPMSMERLVRPLLLAVTLAGGVVAIPLAAQPQRPDTEFCARMRARDPGGICTPKGEYVTAEKVYLPDGRVINRTTGS
jgi:hypothetical protein